MVLGGSALTVTLSGLTPILKYDVRIKTRNGNGESEYGPEASFSTREWNHVQQQFSSLTLSNIAGSFHIKNSNGIHNCFCNNTDYSKILVVKQLNQQTEMPGSIATGNRTQGLRPPTLAVGALTTELQLPNSNPSLTYWEPL